MSDDVKVMIARTEAGSAVDADAPLEDRFRAAFTKTRRHWMATDEHDQYVAAVEAVYLSANDEERARILPEIESIRDLNALLSGVPVDPTAIKKIENPIGILRIYREVLQVDA